MYTIKRIDTTKKAPATYELTAYPSISDVHEQLSKLGAGNESKWSYERDYFADAQAGELILTATSTRGGVYEVRKIKLYGYSDTDSTADEWTMCRIIDALKGDKRAIDFVRAFAELQERKGR